MIKLIPRPTASQFWRYGSPISAVILTLLTGSLLFAALGESPVEALTVYFISPISDWYGVSELFVKPYLFCFVLMV